MISGPPALRRFGPPDPDAHGSGHVPSPFATQLAPPRTPRGFHRAAIGEIMWILVQNCGQLSGCEYPRHLFRRRTAPSGSQRASAAQRIDYACVTSRERGRGRGATRRGGERSTCRSGRKCVRTCDDPRRGGERGSSPRPTRGGRSRTGLARSRTIRDFHGVPESLLRQTHAPHLTPNGGRLCSPRGKPLRASLDSPYCRVLRPGQDRHCEVEHADLQQVLLPGRPDQSAGRTAHRVHPVRVPGGRRRPRPDGADARVSLRPLPGLERRSRCGRSSPRPCTT